MSAPMNDHGPWIECWQCGGLGKIAGCFEDCCSCDGDPEDAEYCCSPSCCNLCKGKCGWRLPDPETAVQRMLDTEKLAQPKPHG